MMLFCVNPHDKEDVKKCLRNEDDPCCMCPGKSVLVKIEDINEMIELLKVSGSNTKQAVLNKLQELVQ